ncbi:MAG: ParB/RepB/Spo0J family partition protein [Gammaproteobacteria bacterium]
MVEKRRGLGRNLGMLLSSTKPVTPASPVSTTPMVTTPPESPLQYLPIELLQRGKYQPRRDMHPESLQELADSIKSQGILQPIVVRPIGLKQYEIIAGERRWRAAQLAELTEVPTLIRDVPDEAAIAIALIENIQRENLNPMEEAIALDRLCREFALTHQQVAEAVGKSRATITNLLRLMQLQHEVKQLLEAGKIDMGHARALLTLDRHHQIHMANTIVEKGLSVREAEKLVHHLQTPKAPEPVKSIISPDIRRLEQRLSDKFGAAVHVEHNNKGKGRLMIHYNSTDELEGILAHFLPTSTETELA